MRETFYNENDRFAADWLEGLIAGGQLSPGRVDRRSIADLGAEDLSGYTQAHFFAGIGGWPLALRLAGWPDDCPVWTGSCPCQPFSQAGRRRGVEDERHLWPVWRPLIAKFRPPTVFGEQVASKDGRLWLDGVRADLGAMGYAVGAADLCAGGVGAPHIRQRLYWMAYSKIDGRARGQASRKRRAGTSHGGGMGDTECGGRPSRSIQGLSSQAPSMSHLPSFWEPSIYVPCNDGKTRRLEPGITPLVARFPGRVGLLRGYGNAIVVPLAVEFIKAVMAVFGEEESNGQ